MKENNDVELANLASQVQAHASLIDKVMRDGSPHSVLTLAGYIEDAARKLGWKALELTREPT